MVNMYRMVRSAVTTSQARDRLLDAAVEHALNQGIIDLSLREIVDGDRHEPPDAHLPLRVAEGVLVAVVREVERRERQTFGDAALSSAGARRLWDRLADPSLRTQERLFFEITRMRSWGARERRGSWTKRSKAGSPR